MTEIPNAQPDTRAETLMDTPDKMVDVRKCFGIDIDMEVPAFSQADERVPDTDPAYVFDPDTTMAILAGFAHNRRVMVQGYHGTGKSSHIEQVAARLNWPCIRINLDAHISRIDLVGRDAIVLRDGQQVTEFQEGLLPWALQHPVAARLVPLGDLKGNQNADDDDQEIEKNRGPFLFAEVCDHATQDHECASPPVAARDTPFPRSLV